jgi:hypothetical protein
MRNGRRIGAGHSVPKPYTPPETPEGRINVTDPDSKVVKGLRGWIQGYNAQAVTNEHQIVLAAEIDNVGADFGHLEPMLDAARRELAHAGVDETPEVLLADNIGQRSDPIRAAAARRAEKRMSGCHASRPPVRHVAVGRGAAVRCRARSPAGRTCVLVREPVS